MGQLLGRHYLDRVGATIKAACQVVFPDQCPQCGDLVAASGGLCAPCWRKTPFILGLVCDLCGAAQMGPDDGYRVHCDPCRSLARPWLRGRSVLEYRGGARRMVLGFKHGDRLDLAPIFAAWMADRAAPLVLPDMVLVPVPVHRFRLLARRYNQAAVLARRVAPLLGLSCVPDALLRVRSTPPMSGDGHVARAALLEGAIAAHPARTAAIAGRPVCLIDDVMTSGATLAACAIALQDAGSGPVSVLTLARAPQRS